MKTEYKEDKKARIRRFVKQDSMAAGQLADAIAGFSELGFREVRSARALADFLADRGFAVTFPWPRMPTAFKAMRGEGRPCIGLLAEYDALPNCGLRKGQPGHGCGHNLLGAGAALAAVAAVRALNETGLAGTITLWGCPAEEMLAGKAYMASAGAFRRQAAILGWHPSNRNAVHHAGGAAMDSVRYVFHGKTAHAAAHPQHGRSALDAVILLDVAANYLREHIPDNVRIHMCIPDGGDAPNVVPAHASGWYYVRGQDRAQVDAIRRRLDACAHGAAMATGTRLRITRETGVYQRLRNGTLSRLILDNLKLFGAPRVTAGDRQRLRELGLADDITTVVDTELNIRGGIASSDEDNVSWLAPFGRVNVVCKSRAAIGHHRDTTAQVTLPLAHRGLQRAAEILAACAFDLAVDARLRSKTMAEFRRSIKGFTYDPLVGKQ